MRILVLGSGGREHALAWKLRQSPRVDEVLVLPGNGGTGSLPEKLKKLPPLACALEVGADITVVGPEALLAAGVVDEFQAKGLKIWGPNRAAAQIEASKAFAKSFMKRYGIPTAESVTFSDFQAAADYLESRAENVVIKASGLAAGKGVILPESPQEGLQSLREIMLDKKFGAAGDQVVIEERLNGPEISVLAFCDGRDFILMPPAQDHKRAFEHDTGPNTGGMGAYAPAPICTPQLLAKIGQRVIQPTLAGLLAEGCPYVGVLYAGLMLTEGGPKVLEFNCRLGDPETQVILPLLETDLLTIIEHSLAGTLSTLEVAWKEGSAATVVLASGGYPGDYETSKQISGLAEAGELEGVVLFHAGTRLAEDGRLLTAGGRVLNVTGIGSTLAEALAKAYAGAKRIDFEGIYYRTDIGAKASMTNLYESAGVSIDAGQKAVDLMKAAVSSTHGPQVLAGVGAFGGLFNLTEEIGPLSAPTLVASTDGVGTKVKLAAALGQYEGIGHDIVNHCLNDILCAGEGVKPLFFLDYVASSKLEPTMVARIVGGIAAACRELGCALLGGETAEMPGVYQPAEFDLVGTMVGLVDKANLYPRPTLAVGDVLLALPSSGPHTNGYSLIRTIFADVSLETEFEGVGTLGQALLAPHRAYLAPLVRLRATRITVQALAHITGGGLTENIPRALAGFAGLTVRISQAAWPLPPLFRLIQAQGEVSDEEMRRVFNMGLGLVAIIPKAQAGAALTSLGGQGWLIGEVIPGSEIEWV